ncbi:hypothetical protein NP233_g9128 [Leucocoprinus birnbaumii]|uniref:Uncharacterized protein n=1 Tax=Leucocoprinus birnbaumii TaxID=56174 RepID=A0AAD5YT44_9AGAR|nr:hypothetical protein NP233_g9128 [Leucocoprinus birnbaumii]
MYPRELEIDPRTGMKNYIANENGNWDTSKALVRRTIERCIHLGRQHRSTGQKQDEYEAFRLLGQAMHTLEDFPAHSNFCELALHAMGHQEVFLHVGDQVRVQAPNGKWVAPIGPSDQAISFIPSLERPLITWLPYRISTVNSTKPVQSQCRTPVDPEEALQIPTSILRDLFGSVPGGMGGDMSRDLDNIDRIRAGPAAGGKRPEDMSPQELHSVLWQVLTFRDSVFVLTTLEPFLKPIMKTATTGLGTVSGEVINTHDQYEVFNDPRASDPTHSFLSKDHFNLILNEPAGRVARAIVHHTVTLVVKAWDNPSDNVHTVTEDILQCLFHPEFHNSSSKIQREMLQVVRDWFNSLGHKQSSVLSRLSKSAVRNHENIRLAGEGGAPASQGSFADSQAHAFQHSIAGSAWGGGSVFGAAGSGSGPPVNSYGAWYGTPGLGLGALPHQGWWVSATFWCSSSSSSWWHGGSSYPGMHAHGGGPPAPPHHSGYNPSYVSPPPTGGPPPPAPAPAFPGAGPGGFAAPRAYPPPPGGPPPRTGSYPPPPGGPPRTGSYDSYPPPPGGGPPPSFPGGPGAHGGPMSPVGGGGFGFPHAAPGGGPPEPFGGGFGGAPGGFPAPDGPGPGPGFFGGGAGGGPPGQQYHQQHPHGHPHGHNDRPPGW